MTVGLAATAAAAAVSIAIRAEKEVAAYANFSTILQVRKIYLKYIPETAKMFLLKSFGLTPVTVYVFFSFILIVHTSTTRGFLEHHAAQKKPLQLHTHPDSWKRKL